MPSNYKSKAISGNEYTRCKTIIIDNPILSSPMVTFREETAIVLSNGRAHTESSDEIVVPFQGSKVINILDLTTNQPTGEVLTMDKIYQIIYSVYLSEALVRDARGSAGNPPI